MKKTLLLIGLIGLLSSCNSTLNKKYSKQLVNTDFEKLKLNLDSVQLQNIKSGIHRLETAGKKLELMSYQEILNNELQHNSDKKKLIKTWDNYSTCSSQKEAKEYVELNCLGMFYSSVPPNSDIIKLIEIDGAEVYRNHGRIFIRLGDYVNWLTLKKN
ncbi:MAG: hypothetical protein KKF20_02250, partial [Bacteroidetes bacterium]|nr:hypothetical protein [Bacteroidota bacterium]